MNNNIITMQLCGCRFKTTIIGITAIALSIHGVVAESDLERAWNRVKAAVGGGSIINPVEEAAKRAGEELASLVKQAGTKLSEEAKSKIDTAQKEYNATMARLREGKTTWRDLEVFRDNSRDASVFLADKKPEAAALLAASSIAVDSFLNNVPQPSDKNEPIIKLEPDIGEKLRTVIVAEMYIAEIKPKAWYHLHWARGGNCLDVYHAGREPGTPIVLGVPHPAQVWRFIPTGEKDCYHIQSNINNAENTLYLTADGSTHGSHALQGTARQTWRFRVSESLDGYYIENTESGLHLHALEGATAPGSWVGVARYNPDRASWRLKIGPEHPPDH